MHFSIFSVGPIKSKVDDREWKWTVMGQSERSEGVFTIRRLISSVWFSTKGRSLSSMAVHFDSRPSSFARLSFTQRTVHFHSFRPFILDLTLKQPFQRMRNSSTSPLHSYKTKIPHFCFVGIQILYLDNSWHEMDFGVEIIYWDDYCGGFRWI